ncbi:MAG: ribosome maturation factor RimM [Bacteroidales bacterium]|nr:ribosome maturation factor RimM [Bacteroidales bacterium]
MGSQEYYYLGYVQKLHAADGRLKIILEADDPEEYQGLDALFMKIGANYVPFLVEEFLLQAKGHAIVALQDVEDKEQATVLVGKEIYLPIEALPELDENRFYYHEIKGFTVTDKNQGVLGKVNEVLEYPGQDLIQVFYNGHEVLIPINDETIISLDRTTKTLYVKMPEGLLDVFLTNENE